MCKRIILTAFFFLILLLSNCKYDTYDPNLCFERDILPVFVSNCSMTGCHDGGQGSEGFNLSNYEGIMKGVKAGHPGTSEIYTVIKGSNPSMPTGSYPMLSKENVKKIKTWIQMGAHHTSNCSSSCDTSNYTYSGRIKPLLDAWCVGCHGGNNVGGGIDLSGYQGLINAVQGQRLLGGIKQQPGYSAMPKNTSPLQPCDIDAIEKWINEGMPNN
jgi:hypothetical protein